MPRPNSEVGSIRLQQHSWGLPCPPAEQQKGQLTFGFPHWSHFAYLAGKKQGEGCWLNETNMRQARVTGCHLYKSCCDQLVRIQDVASYDRRWWTQQSEHGLTGNKQEADGLPSVPKP